MRIGIATDGACVSPHFGHCPTYTLVDVESGSVVRMWRVESPEHRPNFLPRWLKEQGVDVVISGGMGPKAISLFTSLGIEPIVGVSGRVEDVLDAFLEGRLNTSGNACEHGHHCHHE